MNKKDKKVINNSAIAVIDGMASAFDSTINGGIPSLTIAWSLVKGLYTANIELRKERAIEFIEMIISEPSLFTNEILSANEFQDAFVYTFEKYLTQRHKEKREIIKKIFIGLIEELDNDYELEKFIHITEQISLREINLLKIFFDNTLIDWHKKQYGELPKDVEENKRKIRLNDTQISMAFHDIHEREKLGDASNIFEILLGLQNLGLLNGGINMNFSNKDHGTFKLSSLGENFGKYITQI